MNAKLTAKETALLTMIATGQFTWFDDGLTEGSGIWTTCLTEEAEGSEVSATQRGVATVVASLGRKGFLETNQTGDGEGAWTALTEAGAAWCNEHEAKVGRTILEQVTIAQEEEAEAAPAETTTTEWTTEDGTEWIHTSFADLSAVTRRRRQVSGAWRTDFWGITADQKKVSILSRDAKAAREAGTFTI